MDYLIKNAVLLPGMEKTDFCIVGGQISMNIEDLRNTEHGILDLDGRLILKGFTDIHVHLDKVFMNDGLKEPDSLEDAIRFMHEYKQSAK